MQFQVLQFLASFAAVALLVGVAYLFGFRQSAQLASDDEARELFQLAPGGFEPVELGVDANREAAIARDRLDRVGVLVPHGNQFVFRLLAPGSWSVAHDGTLTIAGLPGVIIRLGERAKVWASTDIGDNSD